MIGAKGPALESDDAAAMAAANDICFIDRVFTACPPDIFLFFREQNLRSALFVL